MQEKLNSSSLCSVMSPKSWSCGGPAGENNDGGCHFLWVTEPAVREGRSLSFAGGITQPPAHSSAAPADRDLQTCSAWAQPSPVRCMSRLQCISPPPWGAGHETDGETEARRDDGAGIDAKASGPATEDNVNISKLQRESEGQKASDLCKTTRLFSDRSGPTSYSLASPLVSRPH